jgi:hypothetical protein
VITIISNRHLRRRVTDSRRSKMLVSRRLMRLRRLKRNPTRKKSLKKRRIMRKILIEYNRIWSLDVT